MVARDWRIGIGREISGQGLLLTEEKLTAGNVLGESQAAMEAVILLSHAQSGTITVASLFPYTLRMGS